MFSILAFLFYLVWFAKPLYWLARYLYTRYHHTPDDTYYAKLQTWLQQTWDYVKWQESDL